jgi:protein-tyrosine phosphatase
MADTRQDDRPTTTRWLGLDSVLNLRDVGGLPVTGGGSIRPKTLLRSGSLSRLTAADAATLVAEYGLRTVVDLRTPDELATDGPTALARAGVATAHLPLMADVDEAMAQVRDDADAVRTLAQAYRAFLDLRGEHLVTAARLVAWTGTGSVLVHCAAGKDRTGVFCALVADTVGVARDAVVHDYAMSNERLEAVLRRGVGTEYEIDLADIDLYRCPPYVMTALLAELDTDGSGAGWLRRQGLPEEELERLRARFA